jgi:hypothetical protein
VLFSNDDRNLQDKSSLITFTAPVNGTYYVKSFHGPGFGIYGSYDIAVSGGSTQTGGGSFTPSASSRIQRKRAVVDTGTPPTGSMESSNNE